jgi:hypothetical protein
MIIDLNSCKLINREDRYIALDSYTYLGNSYSILPKYIDINYEARQEELDRRFQSIQTVVGSAGITLIGQHGEVDYSLREYPLFTVNRLLHTMIDRVDSMELFRKWLRWYRDLGFDAISIAINSKKSLSSITNIVHLEAQRVFDAVLVSNWPFEHRYKPSFSEIPYVGNPEVLQHFHSYAPGNRYDSCKGSRIF